MKTFINKIKFIVPCIALLGFMSCNNDEFLENETKTVLTDDTQWANGTNADIFINDIYNAIPRYSTNGEQLDYYSDDYNSSYYYTSHNFRQGIEIAPGGSTGNPWFGTHGPTNGYEWSAFFNKLRKANTGLKKLEENKDNFTDEYYNKRRDEIRFLRAFFYSEYFVQVGGLPILTVPLDRNTMTEDEMSVPRGTFEETFNFITTELGEVVANGNLAVKYNGGDANAGRATLGAALGLKGWIELFGASQLFNSGTPYLPDPKNYVHFASASPARWATAAATNKKFIDDYEGTYNLFGDLPNLWRASNEYNSEIIWDRQIVANIGGMGTDYERRGGVTYVLGAYTTWGNYNPTQEVVDAFKMANGLAITDPGSGYDPQDPYTDREPRFYDFIVYDGAPYKLDWMAAEDVVYTRIDEVNPSPNQIDLAGATDVGDSGYYQKKRMNPDAAPGGDASGQNDVLIRYAEVLLNYAEAQNEAVGPDASVYTEINKLRTRGGVPTLQVSYPLGLTQAEMRTIIRKERRVELSFENKRFLDQKRWKIMEITNSVPRTNMVIRNSVPSNNSGVWVYSPEPEIKFTSAFLPKQYMSPIPQNVFDQNVNMNIAEDQNPGYN